MSKLVYLSLGSNLGDREENIAGAISMLKNYSENTIIKSASLYETKPLYNEKQPDFLNTVVELETTFKPTDLLGIIKDIENLLGRPKKHNKNEPRTIDIDILTFGDVYLETEDLKIPHQGIPYRKFVLIPFSEIAPDYFISEWKVSVETLLKQCPDKSLVTKYLAETMV